MKRIHKFDRLLLELRERIFLPIAADVPLKFRRAENDQRPAVVAGLQDGWIDVGPDLVWGEPEGYFWFKGTAEIPEAAHGKRIFLKVEAQFGSVMGRSDPQLLTRIDGRIAQGGDGNHREVLLTENAVAGTRHDVLIEVGTIEDRRQMSFACHLTIHDPLAEKVYYDLRVPLDVARLLAEDDARRHFILNHIDDALARIDFRPGDAGRFQSSLQEAEAIAQPIYGAEDFSEKPVITLTGYTHIDVAWLWRVRETRQKMARSIATALNLMDQYPDYRFMLNQGVLFDYLEQDYPELFERILHKVKEGAFEIEGALWLEPDANVTGGESFVRHILHGVAYHEEKFGVRPRIMWLPDTFGYSPALPQLMKLSGLDTFITHKMSWNDTNRMPFETFWWKGVDGTKVPTYFLTMQPYTAPGFNTTYCPDLKPTHVMGAWKRHGQKALNKELFAVYGHGDGGGGPTREMLENVRRMEKGIPGCPAVVHDRMRPFFERLVARMNENPSDFPTWDGELYLEFHRGTLTSVAKNKRNNRFAEQMLRELEALATLAMVEYGTAYPSEILHRLWRIVLLNQFHDILPGSSIGAVFDDSDREYAEFFSEATRLRSELIAAFAGTDEFVIPNPLGRVRDGLATIDGDEPLILDFNGNLVPTQTIARADGRRQQAAPVRNIPALGILVGGVTAGTSAEGTGALAISRNHLENDRLTVRFNDKGRIQSILDKTTGREAVTPGQLANRLVAFRDMPAQFDAWDIDESFEDQSWDIDDLQSVEIVETGPYRAALRFVWVYEQSTINQVVSLEMGASTIEVDTFIEWKQHHTLVKVAFPINVFASETTAEIQFGHMRRPTHRNTSWDQARFETVMHRWVDMSEQDFGVALLNDCKYGYDAKEGLLRLTLLRSPTYPWPDADQGEHRFRYGIHIHHGLLAGEGVPALAESFNAPLRLHAGSGSTTAQKAASLFDLTASGIAVESVKKAEIGNDLIVRLWETQGRRNSVTLTLPEHFSNAAEVDLLERDARPLPFTEGQVRLDFAPFEIRSLKLTRRVASVR
ncbi:alpha-mannosidase [Rhizobium oryzicola]|uniref:Glycoside hydrolase family 38 C-terminal domain-containing protein n=1 Tax=Rhizobium oryzicola TaxID=1232668 RepID=A0ABT8SXD7_9HYPH|nr:glycoside hydrolase family 38 C-terminal domain-containing protein [Rhizobium oryzicola]MDO1583125.1 glycoside hydrolase family 38 C-terminal domain-containing protein [Rhizobium oryzicola]